MDNKGLLEAQLKRIVTRVFKHDLALLEEIKQIHLANLASISSQFPPEFLERFDYFNLPQYSRYRKRVLDSGNDAIREIQTILEEIN